MNTARKYSKMIIFLYEKQHLSHKNKNSYEVDKK